MRRYVPPGLDSSHFPFRRHCPCSRQRFGRMTRMTVHITTISFGALIQEEVATVELVDATDPGEHNDNTVADPEAGLASQTVPLDDSTSQANVSIRR